MSVLPRSLNAQLVLLVSCILLVTGAISGWLTAQQQSSMLVDSMRMNTEIMTKNLGDRAAYFLVLQDFAGLESFMLRSVERADLLRLQVCEPGGVVVGDVTRDPTGIPRSRTGTDRISPPTVQKMVLFEERGALVVWQPIEAGNLLGWIKADYSMSAIHRMETATWRNSVLLSFIWVACSIALLLLVLRPFVRGVGRLAGFARGLDARKGEQMTFRQGTAELEELGASLNYASSRLFGTERELLRERQALQEQYSTLRGIIESTDSPIFSVDRQYRYTSFNTAHASVMRELYRQEIRIGESMLDFMTVPEDREKAKQNLDRALAGERFVDAAYSGEDARTRLYVEVSHNPILAGEGPAIGVAVFSRDITARKRAEDELRRANRELRAISRCSEILMRATDENALLQDICRIICGDAGYRMAWVGYAENDNARTVRPVAHAGVEDGYLASAHITWADTERGRGPTGRAIRSGESVCIQDFETDLAAAPWRENALRRGYRSSIALPLKDERGNTFGALMIYSAEPQSFTPDEIRLLGELARDLAFGIGVLRSRNERAWAEDSLRRLNDELEQRVKDRTVELEKKNRELERMNRLFVGRELKMVELKEKIAVLEKSAEDRQNSISQMERCDGQ